MFRIKVIYLHQMQTSASVPHDEPFWITSVTSGRHVKRELPVPGTNVHEF